MKKGFIIAVIIISSLFIGTIAVKAYLQDLVETTLNMGANTYLYGQERTFSYSKFKTVGTVTNRSTTLPNKIYMKLYSKNWLGVETNEGYVEDDYTNRATYGYDWGSLIGSGSKRYIYYKTRNYNDTQAFGDIYSDRTYLVGYTD